MPVKKFALKSKTVLLNLSFLVANFIPTSSDWLAQHPNLNLSMAVLNILLRFLTDQPISFDAGPIPPSVPPQVKTP